MKRKRKKPVEQIHLENEDWKALGLPKKSGRGGVHKDRRTKRRRSRSDSSRDAIERSRNDYE